MRKIKIFQTSEFAIQFESYEFIKKLVPKLSPYANGYEMKFETDLSLPPNDIEALNMVYETSNLYGFKGAKMRSLSMSDIIKIDENYYVVDRYGFEKLDV